MITEETIARINELARKKKAEGLTEAELKEQAELRQQYIMSIRENIRSQLDNVDMVQEDGTIVNLGERYREKMKENPKQGS